MTIRGDPLASETEFFHLAVHSSPLGNGEPQRAVLFSGPADLPVEQATTFELVVKLKGTRVLGHTIPRSPLARANDRIQVVAPLPPGSG